MTSAKDTRTLSERVRDAMEEIGELAFQHSDDEKTSHHDGLAHALRILQEHVPESELGRSPPAP